MDVAKSRLMEGKDLEKPCLPGGDDEEVREPNAPKLQEAREAPRTPAAGRRGRGLICITAAPRLLARAGVPPLT